MSLKKFFLPALIGWGFCATTLFAVPLIHKAARTNNLEKVRQQIAAGDNVNSLDQKYGQTPLGFAATYGYLEMAQLLLDSKAEVDGLNINFETPLHIAAAKGQKAIAELLLAHDAKVNAVTRKQLTPLHFATISGQKELVSLLLSKGADVNVKDKDGKTPLQYATEKNFPEIVPLLKDAGAQEEKK